MDWKCTGFKCPVCLETKTKGSTFVRCCNGHSTCKGCLSIWTKASATANRFTCPVCRSKEKYTELINLINDSVDGLIGDGVFIVGDFIDLTKSTHTVSHSNSMMTVATVPACESSLCVSSVTN